MYEGLTYSSALKCTLRLVVYEIDQENNSKDILSAKEQKYIWEKFQ